MAQPNGKLAVIRGIQLADLAGRAMTDTEVRQGAEPGRAGPLSATTVTCRQQAPWVRSSAAVCRVSISETSPWGRWIVT